MIRAFWSFLIHLVVGLLAFGVVMLLTNDQDTLKSDLLGQLFNNPDQLEARRQALAGAAVMGLAVAMAWSWLTSAIFLLVSNGFRPGVASHSQRLMGLWCGLLFLALAGIAAVGWWQIWAGALNFDFNTARLAAVGGVTFVAVLIAYYLGTGLPVKNEVKASVPFAVLLPQIGFMA